MVGSDQKTGVRELNYFDKSDIKSSIARIDEILKCGIFAQENSTNVLFRAAFIEVLIALRDLMYKSERYSSRIDFSDDVQQQHRISDVSDLIKYVRDALCHPDSEDHYIEKTVYKQHSMWYLGSAAYYASVISNNLLNIQTTFAFFSDRKEFI